MESIKDKWGEITYFIRWFTFLAWNLRALELWVKVCPLSASAPPLSGQVMGKSWRLSVSQPPLQSHPRGDCEPWAGGSHCFAALSFWCPEQFFSNLCLYIYTKYLTGFPKAITLENMLCISRWILEHCCLVTQRQSPVCLKLVRLVTNSILWVHLRVGKYFLIRFSPLKSLMQIVPVY